MNSIRTSREHTRSLQGNFGFPRGGVRWASSVVGRRFIVADNVLWSGRVVESDGDESTKAIKAFNDHVAGDDRVELLMMTVRDGMTLIRRR